MTYRKIEAVNRLEVNVVVGYDPHVHEYRCRLYEDGKAYEPADYFTDDKADAKATAQQMADRAYVNRRDKLSATITTEEINRLAGAVWDIWQYIGSDLLAGCEEPIGNEAAIECCLDADRPLTCTQGPPEVARHEFCKAMYAKYGFDTVTLAVSKILTLV